MFTLQRNRIYFTRKKKENWKFNSEKILVKSLNAPDYFVVQVESDISRKLQFERMYN
jgi:hypothetical protein